MSTPIPRPWWLKYTALLGSLGVIAWPVLAMLGILGVVSAQTVLNVGIVTAALAFVSIRRIKQDREIAMGATGGPPDDSAEGPDQER